MHNISHADALKHSLPAFEYVVLGNWAKCKHISVVLPTALLLSQLR